MGPVGLWEMRAPLSPTHHEHVCDTSAFPRSLFLVSPDFFKNKRRENKKAPSPVADSSTDMKTRGDQMVCVISLGGGERK